MMVGQTLRSLADGGGTAHVLPTSMPMRLVVGIEQQLQSLHGNIVLDYVAALGAQGADSSASWHDDAAHGDDGSDQQAVLVKMVEAVDYCSGTARAQTYHAPDGVAESLAFEHDLWSLALRTVMGSTRKPRDLWHSFYGDIPQVQTYPGILKCRRVIEWLQKEAGDALDRSGGPDLAPLDDPAYRLAYSRAAKKRAFVSDPDYLSKVEPQDRQAHEVQAEMRLMKECFKLLRAGRLDEIQLCCREAGQPWRAACVPSAPSIEELGASAQSDSRGQPGGCLASYRALVRRLCLSDTAFAALLSPHERALYSVFGGSLDTLLNVCESYHDEVWARLVILLRDRIDMILEATANANVNQTAMDDTLQSADTMSSVNVPDILDSEILEAFLATQKKGAFDDKLSGICRTNARSMLGIIALLHVRDCSEASWKTNFVELVRVMKECCASQVSWLVRSCAHMLLLLRRIYPKSVTYCVADSDAILASYCAVLFDSVAYVEHRGGSGATGASEQEHSLQEVYTLAMRYCVFPTMADTQTRLIATLLKDALYFDLIAEKSAMRTDFLVQRRTLCLQVLCEGGESEEMERVRLAAAKQSVEMVWHEKFVILEHAAQPTRASQLQEPALASSEVFSVECIVRAIEFFLYPDMEDATNALRYCNTAIRRFVLLKRMMAALDLIKWIPEALFASISSVDDFEVLEAQREFQCWLAYMEGIQAYQIWSHDRGVESHAADWSSSAHNAEGVSSALLRILEFDGGWLRPDVKVDADTNRGAPDLSCPSLGRQFEMDLVRKEVLPTVMLMLARTLQGADQSVLAGILVENWRELADAFTVAELGDLLRIVEPSLVTRMLSINLEKT
ncbi:Nuclear pore complex protein [Porphyridium purpureum]|uniref:Nuclear pore complex protein n=1 Tax=Porphyridium purpureum TaxID=35688 RepID=A0A5J4Z0S1_PORPP|nr:Nuclear pore complex protein [Porphyridium purpureum]|eukprot:POR2131..scf208_2